MAAGARSQEDAHHAVFAALPAAVAAPLVERRSVPGPVWLATMGSEVGAFVPAPAAKGESGRQARVGRPPRDG